MNLDSITNSCEHLVSQANRSISDLRSASNGSKVFAATILIAIVIGTALWFWTAEIHKAQDALNLKLLKETNDQRLLHNAYGARYGGVDNSSAYIVFNTNVSVFKTTCELLPCIRFYVKQIR